MSALSEFWTFQMPTNIQSEEVAKTTRELEAFAHSLEDVMINEFMPMWLWNKDKNTTVQGVDKVSSSSLVSLASLSREEKEKKKKEKKKIEKSHTAG